MAVRLQPSVPAEHWQTVNTADVTDSDNIAVDTQNMYFTATMKANSITTYTIEGVDGIKKSAGSTADRC